MAILTFPNIVPDNLTFGIQYNTFVSNTMGGQIAKTVEIPGARWKGSMSFSDLTPSDSIELKTFLLKLRGSAGRFYFNDLSKTQPLSGDTTTPISIESPSTQRILNVSDSTNLSIGDYIQLGSDENSELKMIVNITTGDNITVEPMIRAPVSTLIGTDIVYSNPVGVFMLTSDEQAMWDIRGKSYLSTINLDFLEAF